MRRPQTLVRVVTHVVSACPVLSLGWIAYRNQLGTDPATYVVHELGFWGVVLLWASLAMTPLRILSRQSYWMAARRPLGLWSFFYICLHLSAFLLAWCGFDPVVLREEILERPYILIGLLAWILMIPLAATSPQSIRRRMGKRWILLHRLVYGIAVLGLIHLAMATKLEYVKPIVFGILLIFLFFIRFKARQSRRPPINCAPSA